MSKYTTPPDNFKVGEIYDNDQIHRWFGVANSGGIRPSIDEKGNLKHIIMMTTKEEANYKFVNPYADKIEDGILVYTGAGSVGDQALTGVNKRIVEQLEKPVPIVFFIKEARNKIRFVGNLILLRHYQDFQLDSYRSVRKVQVFEFKIIENIQPITRENLLTTFLPHYSSFKSKSDKNDLIIQDAFSNSTETMEQLVEKEIFRNKLLSVNPYDFEEVMAELIKHTGFTNVQVTKKSGDGGIDIKASIEHHFSPEIDFHFQVKRWRHSVGRPDVANLRGSIGYNNFGVMISTSHFTKSAISEANADEKKPINLVGIDLLHSIVKSTGFQLTI
jgi:hypothetical protein